MTRILMTVAAALGIAGAARADSFHVATTGDDAATGTSAALSFSSLPSSRSSEPAWPEVSWP